MFERVQSFFDAYAIRPVDCKVLVAVSGGLDSMALLHALGKMGVNIGVAHMNYGLRGEASEADEAFVRTYCASHDIPFHTRKATISKEGDSLQMQARALRYGWFDELVSTFGYTYVATAHHLNDSLETTLLHLTKGTGLAGLTGIPEKNERYIRPFSHVSRAEIRAYAVENGIQWREDASNAESKYQRNKMRNGVVPLLEEINPSVVETFRHTRERLQGAHALMERELERLRKTHLRHGAYDTLDLGWFETNSLGFTLLSELLKPYGVSYLLAKDIGTNNTVGARFLTDSHQIVLDRQVLIFSNLHETALAKLEVQEEGSYHWGGFTVELKRVGVSDFEKSTETHVAFFDADRVVFPIRVRSWQEGDWFVPLGMTGKKKISDFMIDHKIALTLKSQIPLFTTDGGIFWVGGYRIDDRFKVTEKTKDVIRIKLSHGV